MPYVAVRSESAASRLSDARVRWEAVLAARSDLEPAVRLQETLIGIVVDIAEATQRQRVPKLSLPPKYLAAKLAQGIPAFAGEPVPLPVASLRPGLVRLAQALSSGGAGDAAEHIRSAIEANQLDAGSLLDACFSRNHGAIRTGAVHRGLAPDLVWLIAELALSPFAHALQEALLARLEPPASAALEAWSHGYCAACGSWPALAEVEAGHRVLRCSFCAGAWELTTYDCIYCRNGSPSFKTAAPTEERKDRRLELCGACGAYLKTVGVDKLSPFPLLAIADLETMDLDVAAMEHGYRRPELKSFRRNSS